MTDLNVEGMALAPGVVETIASIAANEVEGVASVGPSSANALLSKFGGKPSTQGIEVTLDDDGKLQIAVHVEVYYGYSLPDIAKRLREAVGDAVMIQVGVPVGSIDVYIDAISFTR